MRIPRARHAVMVLVLGGLARAASASTTINPTGGTTTGDGLRIVIQPTAAFQIVRAGYIAAGGARRSEPRGGQRGVGR